MGRTTNKPSPICPPGSTAEQNCNNLLSLLKSIATDPGKKEFLDSEVVTLISAYPGLTVDQKLLVAMRFSEWVLAYNMGMNQ